MCGIAGWVGARLNVPIDEVLAPIAHRGPDDWGAWEGPNHEVGLGHRRLAIIDLSPAGHQPMTAQGVPAYIVFNGEIYNFRELREDLERDGAVFRSGSDTEVLLHLYRRDGPDFLQKLNGIFALALWDFDRRSLLCARDPIGAKPFYWTRAGGRFLFASEIKVLLRMPGVQARLNPNGLAQHLTYLWCASPETALEGIRKLEPGTQLTVDDSGTPVRQRSFFEWRYSEDDRSSAEDHAEAVREEVLRSVKRQLVSDVPVGMFLSGGLDSSAIAAAYRRAAPEGRIDAFCSVTEAGDGFEQDWPYAEEVARRFDIDLHAVPLLRMDMEEWKRILWHLEEPQADPAIYHVDRIARHARDRGLKVLLSGAGGDDLFSGYRRHQLMGFEALRTRVPRVLRSWGSRFGRALPSRPAPLRRFAKALDGLDLPTPERIASLFEWLPPARVAGLLRSPGAVDGREVLVRHLAVLQPGVDPLNQMLFLETRGFLPDHNLNYTDKLSMAHGVETRVPLLDLQLIALANRLPARAKLRGLTTKSVLRNAMRPLLPPSVIDRPKVGFGAPLRDWLTGPMRGDVEGRLAESQLKVRGWFAPRPVRRLWDDTLEGRVDGAYTIWAVVTADLWAEQFGVS